MKKGIVKNWMSSPVYTVTPETFIVDARRLLDVRKIRHLPVIAGGKLVGIVTRRGLLRADLPAVTDETWEIEFDLNHQTIQDIMTVNPITVFPNTPMPKAARVMLENKITGLPVVNEQRELVGILTSSDVFRFIIEELEEPLLVAEYMSEEVVVVEPDTSLLEAHRLMGTKRIRALPVLEEERLVGLVTRTDLVSSDPSRFISRKQQELSLKILTQPVEGIMTRTLITVSSQTSLKEAAGLLLEKKIHCLPVVENGKLVGILTESDLFRMVVQKFF